MGVGKNIEHILKQKKISQRILAEQTGLTQGYVSQICHGVRNPTTDVLRKISSALDVPMSFLLEDELDETGDLQLSAAERDMIIRFRKLDPIEQGVVQKMLIGLNDTRRDQ